MKIKLEKEYIEGVAGFLLDKSPYCSFIHDSKKVIMFHATHNGFVKMNNKTIVAREFFKVLYNDEVVVDGDDIYFICCYSELVSPGRIKRGLTYKPLFKSNEEVKATLIGNKLMINNAR